MEIQECVPQVKFDPNCEYPGDDPLNWNGRVHNMQAGKSAPPWRPPYFYDQMGGSTHNGMDLNPRHQYFRIVIKDKKSPTGLRVIPLLDRRPHLIVSTPTCVQRFFPPWAEVVQALQYLPL
jgi:hypothetical protein